MAFTAPRTWTDGELVTASIMNTHIRDNQLTFGPHLIARKASDQSVTSSTALVNDTALQLTVAANEVWQMLFCLRFDGSAAGNLQTTFSFPASGRVDAHSIGISAAGADVNGYWSITTSDAGPLTWDTAGAGTNRIQMIEGIYVGAGTAGTVIFRWAQGTSDATATRVLTHSTLWAVKLA